MPVVTSNLRLGKRSSSERPTGVRSAHDRHDVIRSQALDEGILAREVVVKEVDGNVVAQAAPVGSVPRNGLKIVDDGDTYGGHADGFRGGKNLLGK